VTFLISVIIITKNNVETIEACIDSLLKQTYPARSFEVVFVDGHSRDGTVETIRKYMDVHENTKLVFEDHGTMGYARNVGIAESNGDIVAFTDGDAVVPENWLEKIAEFFCNNKTVAVGGLDVLLSGNEGSKIIDSWRRLEKASGIRAIPRIKTVNFAIRRDVLLSLDGFDPELSHWDEADLMARLQSKGNYGIIRYDPSFFVYHNHGEATISFKKRIEKVFKKSVTGTSVLLRQHMVKVALWNPTSTIGVSFFLIPVSLFLASGILYSVVTGSIVLTLILATLGYFLIISSYVGAVFIRTHKFRPEIPLFITVDFFVRMVGSLCGLAEWLFRK
jgi:glycosyltransferase involved in cell wall biosynthesis